MDPLQTRELTYFLAVAEELHFGRAADRLGIAQPPLSRAIRRLEERLGVSLLERTSRRVALTPAGRVLLEEGRRALDALTAAAQRTRRAAEPDPALKLVMKPGGDAGLLPAILAAYESRLSAVPVDVVVCAAHERTAFLRDGRADVGLLHDPSPYCDLSGLDTEELLVESQVAVLPRHHRLAGRSSVRVEELRDELRTLTGPTGPTADDHAAHDVSRLMQLVALGRAVTLAPESVRGHLRHDLVCVPAVDATRVTMLLAWPQNHRSMALAEFVRIATEVACRQGPATRPGRVP